MNYFNQKKSAISIKRNVFKPQDYNSNMLKGTNKYEEPLPSSGIVKLRRTSTRLGYRTATVRTKPTKSPEEYNKKALKGTNKYEEPIPKKISNIERIEIMKIRNYMEIKQEEKDIPKRIAQELKDVVNKEDVSLNTFMQKEKENDLEIVAPTVIESIAPTRIMKTREEKMAIPEPLRSRRGFSKTRKMDIVKSNYKILKEKGKKVNKTELMSVSRVGFQIVDEFLKKKKREEKSQVQ